MNHSLKYRPAYVGLFAAQTLAVTCNAYLDIHYETFGLEVLLWSIAFGATLVVGNLQNGSTNRIGLGAQKIVLVAGVMVTLAVFLPHWGMPRAGVYFLAMLQVVNNCVTTTRRQLHIGLFASAVIVSFAAVHYRADWTLLFYVIPYVVAVVCTLVAEQINRRATLSAEGAVGVISSSGQGTAILAASSAILLLTALLYAVTPRISVPYLEWRYGQGAMLWKEKAPEEGGGPKSKTREQFKMEPGDRTRQPTGRSVEDPGRNPKTTPGTGSSASGNIVRSPTSTWPTEQEMVDAANRPGMPAWQSGAIKALAKVSAAVAKAVDAAKGKLGGIEKGMDKILARCSQFIKDTHFTVPWLLLLLLLLAFLLYRTKAGLWIRTRYDYMRLVLFATANKKEDRVSLPYYVAMERLLRLHSTPREAAANTQEYLAIVAKRHQGIHPEAAVITTLFERERYGSGNAPHSVQGELRQAYRLLFSNVE
jgi:hypothetical protein